ncbi:Rho GTPase activation protein [Helicostylum pulchrum]|nr:Rho GTPase activation protein [Helicostylum pulchrum]
MVSKNKQFHFFDSILTKYNEGLEIEGIFRVSGSIKRVNALEFQFDQSASSYGLDLNWEGYTVHDAASLLRRYLNKLPVPVIPFEHYQQFRDVMSNNPYRNTEQRIEEFQKLIQSLQPPHQHLLLYLLDTLSLFATTASETKMDIPNLAVVFCPGILRHPDHNTPIQYKISQYVIEFLIEFQSLFTMQLLIPNKRKDTSNAGVPPVPLLVSSSATKAISPSASTSPPPPVPLHVVNPSDPSIKSTISLHQQDSFIDSPQEIVAQSSQERTKPAALLICVSVLIVTLVVIVYEAYLAVTFVSFEPLLFFAGLVSYWGLLYHRPTSSAASIFAADNDISSIMSRSSRFDEEENFIPTADSISSSDEDEDEDLGFDPDTLEAFLSQYDQIKKDAQLAKKLQIEEQKARDENNPFVVEDMAVGTKPLKIDSDVADYDEDQVTTPTDKEAWKIRVFRD